VYRWLQHYHGDKLVRKNLTVSDGETIPLLNQKPDESVIATYELDYALHARGGYDFFATKRGVDHESYAYQLALDLGAAPTFWHMVTKTSWRCVFTWAMGPNFNTKFRLVGPWANPAVAMPIIEGELFGVVRRTGGGFCECFYQLLRILEVSIERADSEISLLHVHRHSVRLVRRLELGYYAVSAAVQGSGVGLGECLGDVGCRCSRGRTRATGSGLTSPDVGFSCVVTCRAGAYPV
jgi:hypothetical protein